MANQFLALADAILAEHGKEKYPMVISNFLKKDLSFGLLVLAPTFRVLAVGKTFYHTPAIYTKSLIYSPISLLLEKCLQLC